MSYTPALRAFLGPLGYTLIAYTDDVECGTTLHYFLMVLGLVLAMLFGINRKVDSIHTILHSVKKCVTHAIRCPKVSYKRRRGRLPTSCPAPQGPADAAEDAAAAQLHLLEQRLRALQEEKNAVRAKLQKSAPQTRGGGRSVSEATWRALRGRFKYRFGCSKAF